MARRAGLGHGMRGRTSACARRRCASSARTASIRPGMLICRDASSKQRGHGRPPEDFPVTEEALLPSGSAALYRRAMLEEIGGFDGSFFLYCEDTDLGLRARWAGWKCLYVPEAVVEHHYSHSAGRASPLKAYYVERNRLFVLAKNFPLGMLLAAPWVSLARYLWHAWYMLRRTRRGGAISRRRKRRAEDALVSGAGACRLSGRAAAVVARAAADPRRRAHHAQRSSAICCARTPLARGGWRRFDPAASSRCTGWRRGVAAGDRPGVQRRRRHRRRGRRRA